MVTTSDRPDAQRAAQLPAPRRSGWLQRRWVAVAVWVAAGIVLFAAYLAQARTLGASSDSAGQALQAWDMLHGNVLLRGWSLSDVSFYTTELPEYMLVELVRGLNGDVVHVAAALSYTLLVVLAGLLAKGRATGREGLLRLLVAAGIMLAPALHFGTYLLLSGPDHVGTHVPLLLIWLVLDRAPARWWVPVVVAVMLAWAQVGDPLVLYEAVLPLAVVCAVRIYRRPGQQSAGQQPAGQQPAGQQPARWQPAGRQPARWQPARRWLAGHWYELSLAVGAVASAVAARLVLTVIREAGGFAARSPIASFSTAAGMSTYFWPKVESVLQVFGADFLGLSFGTAAIAALLHLVGVALVAWAVAAGLRRFQLENDLTVQVLTIAFIVVLAAYVFGTKPDANEIVGLLPIGAVLAGRVLTGRLVRGGLIPALAVVLACYCAILADNAVQPRAAGDGQVVASWLEAHHLRYGLAGYWNANSITALAGDRVQVRPARIFRDRLILTPAESDASWYDASRHDARFVIYTSRCASACLSLSGLVKTFGPAAATYPVGHFRVLVWRKNLLTHLRTFSWCGNVWPWDTPTRPSPGPCT